MRACVRACVCACVCVGVLRKNVRIFIDLKKGNCVTKCLQTGAWGMYQLDLRIHFKGPVLCSLLLHGQKYAALIESNRFLF